MQPPPDTITAVVGNTKDSRYVEIVFNTAATTTAQCTKKISHVTPVQMDKEALLPGTIQRYAASRCIVDKDRGLNRYVEVIYRQANAMDQVRVTMRANWRSGEYEDINCTVPPDVAKHSWTRQDDRSPIARPVLSVLGYEEGAPMRLMCTLPGYQSTLAYSTSFLTDMRAGRISKALYQPVKFRLRFTGSDGVIRQDVEERDTLGRLRQADENVYMSTDATYIERPFRCRDNKERQWVPLTCFASRQSTATVTGHSLLWQDASKCEDYAFIGSQATLDNVKEFTQPRQRYVTNFLWDFDARGGRDWEEPDGPAYPKLAEYQRRCGTAGRCTNPPVLVDVLLSADNVVVQLPSALHHMVMSTYAQPKRMTVAGSNAYTYMTFTAELVPDPLLVAEMYAKLIAGVSVFKRLQVKIIEEEPMTKRATDDVTRELVCGGPRDYSAVVWISSGSCLVNRPASSATDRDWCGADAHQRYWVHSRTLQAGEKVTLTKRRNKNGGYANRCLTCAVRTYLCFTEPRDQRATWFAVWAASNEGALKTDNTELYKYRATRHDQCPLYEGPDDTWTIEPAGPVRYPEIDIAWRSVRRVQIRTVADTLHAMTQPDRLTGAGRLDRIRPLTTLRQKCPCRRQPSLCDPTVDLGEAPKRGFVAFTSHGYNQVISSTGAATTVCEVMGRQSLPLTKEQIALQYVCRDATSIKKPDDVNAVLRRGSLPKPSVTMVRHPEKITDVEFTRVSCARVPVECTKNVFVNRVRTDIVLTLENTNASAGSTANNNDRSVEFRWFRASRNPVYRRLANPARPMPGPWILVNARNDMFPLERFYLTDPVTATTGLVDYSVLVKTSSLGKFTRASCSYLNDLVPSKPFDVRKRVDEIANTCQSSNYIVSVDRVGTAINGNPIHVQCRVDYSRAKERCGRPMVIAKITRTSRTSELDVAQCGGSAVDLLKPAITSYTPVQQETMEGTFHTTGAHHCVYTADDSQVAANVHVNSLTITEDKVSCHVVDKKHGVDFEHASNPVFIGSHNVSDNGCVLAPLVFKPTVHVTVSKDGQWARLECGYPGWYEGDDVKSLCPVARTLRQKMHLRLTVQSNIRAATTMTAADLEGDKCSSHHAFSCHVPTVRRRLLTADAPFDSFKTLVREAGAAAYAKCVLGDYESESLSLRASLLDEVAKVYPMAEPARAPVIVPTTKTPAPAEDPIKKSVPAIVIGVVLSLLLIAAAIAVTMVIARKVRL